MPIRVRTGLLLGLDAQAYKRHRSTSTHSSSPRIAAVAENNVNHQNNIESEVIRMSHGRKRSFGNSGIDPDGHLDEHRISNGFESQLAMDLEEYVNMSPKPKRNRNESSNREDGEKESEGLGNNSHNSLSFSSSSPGIKSGNKCSKSRNRHTNTRYQNANAYLGQLYLLREANRNRRGNSKCADKGNDGSTHDGYHVEDAQEGMDLQGEESSAVYTHGRSTSTISTRWRFGNLSSQQRQAMAYERRLKEENEASSKK